MKNIYPKRVYNGFIKVDEWNIEQESGNTFKREVVIKQDAVCAIVQVRKETDIDTFLFTKQWRPGAVGDVIELVAGTCDVEGETKEECIKREILEELGYSTISCEELIPNFYLSPGYTTERMTIFYCIVGDKIGDGGGVGNENIEVIELSRKEMIQEYHDNKFIDAKTIMGILIYMTKYLSI